MYMWIHSADVQNSIDRILRNKFRSKMFKLNDEIYQLKTLDQSQNRCNFCDIVDS